jgi:hypothetical protein
MENIPPGQIVPLFTASVGKGATDTVKTLGAVQVPVGTTVYEVVTDGLTVMVGVVAPVFHE